MFDPNVGQWLEEDPIGFTAGDPNLRRYVRNGPTNATDPSGLATEPSSNKVVQPSDPGVKDWYAVKGLGTDKEVERGFINVDFGPFHGAVPVYIGDVTTVYDPKTDKVLGPYVRRYPTTTRHEGTLGNTYGYHPPAEKESYLVPLSKVKEATKLNLSYLNNAPEPLAFWDRYFKENNESDSYILKLFQRESAIRAQLETLDKNAPKELGIQENGQFIGDLKTSSNYQGWAKSAPAKDGKGTVRWNFYSAYTGTWNPPLKDEKVTGAVVYLRADYFPAEGQQGYKQLRVIQLVRSVRLEKDGLKDRPSETAEQRLLAGKWNYRLVPRPD